MKASIVRNIKASMILVFAWIFILTGGIMAPQLAFSQTITIEVPSDIYGAAKKIKTDYGFYVLSTSQVSAKEDLAKQTLLLCGESKNQKKNQGSDNQSCWGNMFASACMPKNDVDSIKVLFANSSAPLFKSLKWYFIADNMSNPNHDKPGMTMTGPIEILGANQGAVLGFAKELTPEKLVEIIIDEMKNDPDTVLLIRKNLVSSQKKALKEVIFKQLK